MLQEKSGTSSAHHLEVIIFKLLSAPPCTWQELTVNICKTSSKFPFTTLPKMCEQLDISTLANTIQLFPDICMPVLPLDCKFYITDTAPLPFCMTLV